MLNLEPSYQESIYQELCQQLSDYLEGVGLNYVFQEVDDTLIEEFREELYLEESSFHIAREKLFLLLEAFKISVIDTEYIKDAIYKILLDTFKKNPSLYEDFLKTKRVQFSDENHFGYWGSPLSIDVSNNCIRKRDHKARASQIFSKLEEDLYTLLRDNHDFYEQRSKVNKFIKYLNGNEVSWFNTELSKEYNGCLYVEYIVSLIIQAAHEEKATLEYLSSDGSPVKQCNLIFRKSYGKLYITNNHFTHIVIEFGGKIPPLELHVSIQCEGKSGILHEADILVLKHTEAEYCRNYKQNPLHSQIMMACECKYRSSKLNLDLGRSFIGLNSDLDAQNKYYFISNSWPNKTKSIEKLLTYHRQKFAFFISPNLNYSNQVNKNEVEKLINSFEKEFQRFKNKYE